MSPLPETKPRRLCRGVTVLHVLLKGGLVRGVEMRPLLQLRIPVGCINRRIMHAHIGPRIELRSFSMHPVPRQIYINLLLVHAASASLAPGTVRQVPIIILSLKPALILLKRSIAHVTAEKRLVVVLLTRLLQHVSLRVIGLVFLLILQLDPLIREPLLPTHINLVQLSIHVLLNPLTIIPLYDPILIKLVM